MTWMLLGWGLAGWAIVLFCAVAIAKLMTLGDVGWRDELRRIAEPWRRGARERAHLRQVRRNARMMCDCERRYKGVALG